MRADELLAADVPFGAVEREPVAHVQRVARPRLVLRRGRRQPVAQPQDVGVLVEDRLLVAQPDLGDAPRDGPHDLGELGHRRQLARRGAQRQPGAAVELHRAQTGVDAVDLLADPPRLLLGDPVQGEDRVGGLLGDQPHHPLVGLGQFALVDVLAQRDVVVHPLVEVVAVVGDRVGERRVERVEDAGQFVVGAASALAQLFAFAS